MSGGGTEQPIGALGIAYFAAYAEGLLKPPGSCLNKGTSLTAWQRVSFWLIAKQNPQLLHIPATILQKAVFHSTKQQVGPHTQHESE